jgi:CheY-like chemotaxis protein
MEFRSMGRNAEAVKGFYLIVPEQTRPTKLMTSGSPVCVLVVEDEFFSRLHAVDLVEAAGYAAIEASNADEAIAVLEARKDVRIVLTDIDMPGSMDGLKLAHAIRKRWPPIELILTSGHFHLTDDDMPERGRFFPKPYRDQEIVSALQHFAS